MSITIDELTSYISANVFYTEKWDELEDVKKREALMNNAATVLYRELPHHFRVNVKPIPIDVLAEQVIHMLEFDDSHRRAEMGLSYFFTGGLYVSFDKNYKDRSIARTILHRYPRRRAARTTVSKSDTYRAYGDVRQGDY